MWRLEEERAKWNEGGLREPQLLAIETELCP